MEGSKVLGGMVGDGRGLGMCVWSVLGRRRVNVVSVSLFGVKSELELRCWSCAELTAPRFSAFQAGE